MLEKLDISPAKETWRQFAASRARHPDIGLNPAWYDFYAGEPDMEPFYILLYRGNEAIGLLPLVRIGRKFCSLPHLSYGGIYLTAESGKPGNTESMLIHITGELERSKAIRGFYKFEVANEETTKSLASFDIEIRGETPYFGKRETEKVLQYIPLREMEGEFSDMVSSNIRRKVSKAVRNGVVVKKGGAEMVPDFAKVYNRNIHRIGSPTLGLKFFKRLAQTTDLNVEVFIAYMGGIAVGGAFSLWFAGYYENLWFATLNEYNKYYVSYLLHDQMIQSARELNSDYYSLGRTTRGGGVHRFKSQWPVRDREIYFSKNKSPMIGLKGQRWLSSVWRQLPPFLVDGLGPYFAQRMY